MILYGYVVFIFTTILCSADKKIRVYFARRFLPRKKETLMPSKIAKKAISPFQRTLSQFCSFKTRRATFLHYIKFYIS